MGHIGGLMDANETISLFIQQHQMVNSFWNLYAVVAIGMGAVFASSERAVSDRRVLALLLAMFAFFALTNLLAVQDCQRRLVRLGDALQTLSPPQALMSRRSRASNLLTLRYPSLS
jgi:hypothetical protein